MTKAMKWILLILSATAAFASVFIPAWIIQPFKYQTSQGVAAAYVLRSWAPWLTAVFLIATIAVAALLWSSIRWWKKAAVAILVLISGVCAWFAHQNHFEWLFNPNPDDSYAAIHDADFVAGNDMVLAVEINSDHVAYPVRLLAYHHLINDVVGGTPVVSTY